MRRRLEQWLDLAPWERRMFWRLLVLLPAVAAALRWLGFRRTRALLGRWSGSSTPPRPDEAGEMSAIAERIARLVAIASSHGPYRATCLRQSLALWWVLRRRGIPAELRMGVRKEGRDLRAHAWVEHAGRPLGQPIPEYTPFTALPIARRANP